MSSLTIPENVLRAAAQLRHDDEWGSGQFEGASEAHRDMLADQMKVAAAPIGYWAQMRALRAAREAVNESIGDLRDALCTDYAKQAALDSITELIHGTATSIVYDWRVSQGIAPLKNGSKLVATETGNELLVTIDGESSKGAYIVRDGLVVQHMTPADE